MADFSLQLTELLWAQKTERFFSHKFNTGENQTYVGRTLSRAYFFPNLTMEEKKYNEFKNWYKKNDEAYKQGCYVYNLKAEQLKYCCQDVAVLRLAGEK